MGCTSEDKQWTVWCRCLPPQAISATQRNVCMCLSGHCLLGILDYIVLFQSQNSVSCCSSLHNNCCSTTNNFLFQLRKRQISMVHYCHEESKQRIIPKGKIDSIKRLPTEILIYNGIHILHQICIKGRHSTWIKITRNGHAILLEKIMEQKKEKRDEHWLLHSYNWTRSQL